MSERSVREAGDRGATRSGPQLVVAVFDDWDSLQAVLSQLETGTACPAAVLHARGDAPAGSQLSQMIELHFERSRQRIACTSGRMSAELSARLARGAKSLADALHGWLGSRRAQQLESHVTRGHLVLCVELSTSDDFAIVCGRLVQASPHVVEVYDIAYRV